MKNNFPTIEEIKQSACAARNQHLFQNVQVSGTKRKYGNKKMEIDGFVFDSVKESKRYIELRTMNIKGEIESFLVHPVFELSVCKYEADFSYMQNGVLVVEDVKSKVTRKLSTYRLKKKLMIAELNINIVEK